MSKLELHKSESFQFGNLCSEIKHSNGNVAEATSRSGVVQPVLPAQETGPESGKQEDVPAVEDMQAGYNMAGVVEPVLPAQETCLQSGKQVKTAATVDVIHAEDQTAGVAKPVLPAHETGCESDNQDNVTVLEITHESDQSSTKPVGNNR